MNNVSKIAIECGVDDLPLWRDPEVHETVSKLLYRHSVSEEQFARLVSIYRSYAHMQRLRGLNDEFDTILMADGS